MAKRIFDRSDLIGATLRKVDLFSTWPADVIAAMAQASQLWRYAKGESLFEVGGDPVGIYIPVDGSLFSKRSGLNGRQWATTLMRPGWSTGVLAAWDGIPYPWNAVARSDMTAVLVPAAAFRAAVRGDPKRLEDVIAYLGAQIRQDLEGWHSRAIVSQRCLTARYLAYLARPSMHMSLEEPDAVDPTAFDVTQDELAAMLFCARQTVNQLMKAMEREGVLIRQGNQLRIVNFLKLLAIMEEDEPIYSGWRDQLVAWDAKLRATNGIGTRQPASVRSPAQTQATGDRTTNSP